MRHVLVLTGKHLSNSRIIALSLRSGECSVESELLAPKLKGLEWILILVLLSGVSLASRRVGSSFHLVTPKVGLLAPVVFIRRSASLRQPAPPSPSPEQPVPEQPVI